MKKHTTVLYILIFIVIVAAVVYIFAAGPGSAPDTVPVILPNTSSGNHDPDGSGESAPQIVEVNAGNVQAVLRTLTRTEAYSRTICSENFWAGGQSRRNIDVWVSGSSARMDISRSDGSSTMHILIVDDEKWLWYSGVYGVFEGAAAAGEADRYQSILSYEHILELPKSAITEAGYTEHLGEMCIYIRYKYGELGYDNVCYVSVASGLVMGEESYDGERLVSRISSTAPDLSIPEDSIFEQP